MASLSALEGHSSKNPHRPREKGAECELGEVYRHILLIQGEGLKKKKPQSHLRRRLGLLRSHLWLVFHRKPKFKGYKIIFQTNAFH